MKIVEKKTMYVDNKYNEVELQEERDNKELTKVYKDIYSDDVESYHLEDGKFFVLSEELFEEEMMKEWCKND